MRNNLKLYSVSRGFLIFWTLFIGLGAIAGSTGMLCDPSGKAMGMDSMLPYFQKLPFADIFFNDYTIPGYALLLVNGITNLVAAALLLTRKKAGELLGGMFGITLMLWICIQFYMFPLNFMSTIYFVFGMCQAIAGYLAYRNAFYLGTFPGKMPRDRINLAGECRRGSGRMRK